MTRSVLPGLLGLGLMATGAMACAPGGSSSGSVGVGHPEAAAPAAASSPPSPVKRWTFETVATLPHDRAAFTQGLVVHDGAFYESTGLYGQSSIRQLALGTGEVLRRRDVDAEFFGEGLTILGDRIYQLTWREHLCLVYTLDFEPVARLTYAGEGWGLAQDGAHLILSDGTSDLRILDPATFKVLRVIHVVGPGGPVTELNELELVRGRLLANVWGSDQIVEIDLDSGRVTGIIDLAGLYPERDRRDNDAVLNGIAYDPKTDRLFVTGKRWGRIFELRLRAAE